MNLITQVPAAEAPRVRPPAPIVVPPTRRRRPGRRRSILAVLLASLLFQALLVSLLLHLGVLAWLLAAPPPPLPAAMSPLEVTLVPAPESPTGVEKPVQESPDAHEQPPVAPPSPTDLAPVTPAPPAPETPPAPQAEEPPGPAPPPPAVAEPTPEPAPPPPAQPAIEAPSAPEPPPPPPVPEPTIESEPSVRLETLPSEPANPLLKPVLPPLAKVVPPAPAPRPSKAPQQKPVVPPPMRFSWSDDPLHNGASRPPPAALPRGQIDLSLAPGLRNSPGAPPRSLGNEDTTMRMVGAQVGPEWMQLLHDWWNRHGYYPDSAAAFGQSGTVQLHMKVNRDGSVHDLQLVDGSGSPYLDMGALSVFRGAHLPPFLQNTPESQGDLYLTIQYVLVHR